MLRIGYLTGEYTRVTHTFIQREVRAMRRAGVEVRTFSIRRPGSEHRIGPQQRAESDDAVYYVQETPLPKIAWAHLKLLLRSPFRYASVLWLAMRLSPGGVRAALWQLFYFIEAGIVAHQMKRLNLRHLHNHFADSSCSVAMLAAELAGRTFSVTVHGPYIFFEVRRWRLDEKARRALFMACVSRFCRSQVMIHAPIEKWDRLHIVHCGVEPAGYEPVVHSGAGHRLLYIGRLDTVKGLPVLVEAVARVRKRRPDVRLTIVGDGPLRPRLESMCRELGLESSVRFLGYRSGEEVRQELGRADAFVMSSFAEGVPVVLMEAMACGLPVVATAVGGVSELVEHGESGFVVPPGDEASLARCIELLLGDAGLRQRMGRAGRVRIERGFDVNREAEWLRRILTSALAGRTEPIRPDELHDTAPTRPEQVTAAAHDPADEHQDDETSTRPRAEIGG